MVCYILCAIKRKVRKEIMHKRLFIALMTVIMFSFQSIIIPAEATSLLDSGKCGENLTWKIQGNTLIISGSGPMYDYGSRDTSPWYLCYLWGVESMAISGTSLKWEALLVHTWDLICSLED